MLVFETVSFYMFFFHTRFDGRKFVILRTFFIEICYG